MLDYRNNIVIGLSLLIVFTLYMAGKLKPQNIFALLAIVGLSFVMPMLTMVFIIPIALLVYMGNYQNLNQFWSSLKNTTIS